MCKFSNPKLALLILDEIIIPGHFPYHINIDSDQYDDNEIDKVLNEVLESPIVEINKTNSEETITYVHSNGLTKEVINNNILLSAKIVNWTAYEKLKKNID